MLKHILDVPNMKYNGPRGLWGRFWGFLKFCRFSPREFFFQKNGCCVKLDNSKNVKFLPKMEKAYMYRLVKKNLKISKICHTLLIFVDFPRGSRFPKIVFLFLKFFLTIRCLEVDIEDGQELGLYKWYVYFYEILKFV